MLIRNASASRFALLLSLCAGSITAPLAGLAADSDYNTRSAPGSASSVGGDTSTSGNTSSVTGSPGTTGSESGATGSTGSTSDSAGSAGSMRGSSSTSGTNGTTGSETSSDNDNRGSGSGGYVKSSYITAKVKAALASDRDVTARNIKVETSDQGVVTLSGTVKSQAQIDKALADARAVEGVSSVVNNLQVR